MHIYLPSPTTVFRWNVHLWLLSLDSNPPFWSIRLGLHRPRLSTQQLLKHLREAFPLPLNCFPPCCPLRGPDSPFLWPAFPPLIRYLSSTSFRRSMPGSWAPSGEKQYFGKLTCMKWLSTKCGRSFAFSSSIIKLRCRGSFAKRSRHQWLCLQLGVCGPSTRMFNQCPPPHILWAFPAFNHHLNLSFFPQREFHFPLYLVRIEFGMHQS